MTDPVNRSDPIGANQPDIHEDPSAAAAFRKQQQERAAVMGWGLAGLCVLFFLVTIVKLGVWG